MRARETMLQMRGGVLMDTPRPRRPWASSTRRQRLPSDWTARRAKVKRRARGLCEATTHDPKCDGYGSECDHIVAGDNHHLSNLQWLSTPCHIAKTKAESKAAAQRRRTSLKLPTEAHPNKIT